MGNGAERHQEVLLKFLKETKDGQFTEVPPVVVTYDRNEEMREPNYEEESCLFYYSN